MAISRNQLRWLIAAAAAAFLAIIVTSTLHQTHIKYEVCVTYHNNNHCATAEGATADEAIRSARDIDCELLSNGRDDNVVCLDTQPSSIRQIR
jgi:hypothetical protein